MLLEHSIKVLFLKNSSNVRLVATLPFLHKPAWSLQILPSDLLCTHPIDSGLGCPEELLLDRYDRAAVLISRVCVCACVTCETRRDTYMFVHVTCIYSTTCYALPGGWAVSSASFHYHLPPPSREFRAGAAGGIHHRCGNLRRLPPYHQLPCPRKAAGDRQLKP